MATNTIQQGLSSVDVDILYGYSCELSMNMDSAIDAQGIIRWQDNGKDLDNYSNSFSVQTESPNELETILCSDSVSDIEILKSGDSSFHPFGMSFAVDQAYPINIISSSNGTESLLSEIKQYSIKSVPAITSDIYNTFTASTTLQGRVEQHWSIGGVYFPFVKSENTLNKRLFTSVTNGGSSQVVSTRRDYGDIAEIEVVCSEEQARLILNFFTGTMRGTEQTAVYPLGYNLFGRRYDTTTTCKVKIFSSKITVKHSNLDSVSISFKLQMTGE